MHANGDASGSGVTIVAGQRHLSPLVELARFSESERMSRDHEAAEKRASKLRQRLRLQAAIGDLEARRLLQGGATDLHPMRDPLPKNGERRTVGSPSSARHRLESLRSAIGPSLFTNRGG